MSLEASNSTQPIRRVRVWYGVILCILAIFLVRLFYLQIIRYDHYKNSARSDQLKQYQIPASRGAILVKSDGSNVTIPIVLNQKLYVVYADPLFIKDPTKVASDVAHVTGGSASDYSAVLSVALRIKGDRYAVLAKKVTENQKNKILALKNPGLGTEEQDYRTYPQGSLASQLLGFVNDAGVGSYGIEQSMNVQLKGTAGELKAITDVNGVPLAASSSNVSQPAIPGKNVVLTIDLPMQQQLEKILAAGVQHAQGESGSAVIIDPSTGAIKAMANVPTYDPSKYFDVTDPAVFNNAAVTTPIEVGSVMKVLTTAAALDQGVVTANQTYYDPSHWLVDGFNITNIEEDGGPGTRSITDILNLSLNTGATWELMQMGGGTINTKARTAWYNYMTNHFEFGKQTGIEQGSRDYEAPGIVPSPKDNGAGIDLTYANTAFGQAMTATPVQMAAAMAAVVNGGTYYQPHLVDSLVDAAGKTTVQPPKVVQKNVVSSKVSQELIPILQTVLTEHHVTPAFDQTHYMVGGKTGTAQIAKAGGGYEDSIFNGTYLGFVGGNAPQYVVAVFVNKPKITGYAGTAAAQPIFVNVGRMLIDNSYVTAKN